MVKTVGEGVLASFLDPTAAVRVALELAAARLRTAAAAAASPSTAAPSLVATINDHLDYFGATVSQASRLPRVVAAARWC